jgi:hypothetical protein
MEGNFATPLVIGKTLKPWCVKNIIVNNLRIIWKANHKALIFCKFFSIADLLPITSQ